LVISGTFKNISLLKARAPGILPNAVVTMVYTICIAVAIALPTIS
jgi:hypothetical protein